MLAIKYTLLLFLLIPLVYSAKAPTIPPTNCINTNDEHTVTYKEWKAGSFNSTLFLPNTYVSNIVNADNLSVICTSYCDQRELRKKYIEFLTKHNISCTGSWCINNKFSCSDPITKKRTNKCYNVEHIIDKNYAIPALANYDKNIFGNIIMAYGVWNQQIGNLQWQCVEAEKREIYSDDIVNKAIEYIKKCKTYKAELNGDAVKETPSQISTLIIGLILLLPTICLIIVGVWATIWGISWICSNHYTSSVSSVNGDYSPFSSIDHESLENA